MKSLLYIKNIWLVVGITLVLFFGLEVFSYVFLKCYSLVIHRGAYVDERSQADGYEDRSWAVQYFDELASLPGFKWHPYVYWRRVPSEGHSFNIDEEGLRKTWNAKKGDSELPRVRIFMMGGSTIWGIGARDEETIPSIVAQLLTREYKLNVEVTNFGASGYVTTQEVIALLRELQRGNTPNLVVFYDGVNDTFCAYQNKGVAGIPQNESNREREFNLLRPEQIRHLYKEALLVTFKSSSTYYVLRSLVRKTTGRDLLSFGHNGFVPPPPNQMASEVARIYAWNVKLVQNLGETYGFRTLFYWQPTVYTKDKLTPYERQTRGDDGMKPYYTEATTAVKTQLSNIDSFHDISGVFNGDPRPYFIDDVHVTGAGNEIIAHRMLKDVVPIIQKLTVARREIRR
jgi:lysophospholipase L1-like esterase